LAILALTGLALAVICLTERSFVSLLAWPSAGVNWLATRTRAILAGWKARRATTTRAKRKAEPPAQPRAAEGREAPAPAMTEASSTPPASSVETAGAPPPSAKETGGEKGRERETKPSKGQQAFPFLPAGDGYAKPSVKFLDSGPAQQIRSNPEEMAQNSRLLEKKLLEFGVEGRVTAVNPGPVITSYELEPGPGIKINRIVALADDLALGLKAMSVRVVAPIPGKAAVGVEIPNQHRATVYLRDVLASKEFAAESLQLPLALGQESGGAPMVTDLTQMPHLLIAGETGSGKSVCVNSLILSLVYRAQPKDVRLLLIDPKRVELSVYNGIPHLVDKVVVDPKDAARRLQRVVLHM
jgi:S-DNA-T family DNA segregation ATPase FtsK/SpoIIIE